MVKSDICIELIFKYDVGNELELPMLYVHLPVIVVFLFHCDNSTVHYFIDTYFITIYYTAMMLVIVVSNDNDKWA